jgi:hypothetical protein
LKLNKEQFTLLYYKYLHQFDDPRFSYNIVSVVNSSNKLYAVYPYKGNHIQMSENENYITTIVPEHVFKWLKRAKKINKW